MKISFPLFVILFLIFENSSTTSNLIQYSCQEAAKNDPNLSYNFCVSTLEQNPKTQKASLEGLIVISTKLAISNATMIKSAISKILKENHKLDKHTKGALKDCYELYSDVKPTLRDALRGIKSKDYEKAITEMSAAMDASTTCQDGFEEVEGVGEDECPLSQENNTFFQLAVIPLAFMNMLH